jgi:hypothetical protein
MKSVIIPAFKEGNLKDCNSYRGISVLNSGYNIYANIIKNEVYKNYETIMGEKQNGFCKGRCCCDGYFTVKLLIEKHTEFNIETYIAFICFINAF